MRVAFAVVGECAECRDAELDERRNLRGAHAANYDICGARGQMIAPRHAADFRIMFGTSMPARYDNRAASEQFAQFFKAVYQRSRRLYLRVTAPAPTRELIKREMRANHAARHGGLHARRVPR